MQNHFLPQRTEQDIDRKIAKILNDLDDSQPPLRLEVVRDLLRLDLGYYSGSDPGILQETIHRITVVGKQVIERPMLLVEAVKKLSLKALWIPDKKRILIDTELPELKQRWGVAHEIGHSILPWHELAMHGDRSQELSPTCELEIESEANFAAGRLLFLQDVFTHHLRGCPLSLNTIKTLSETFGNSITSTLWRSVEAYDKAVFGLVSTHPKRPSLEAPVRYFIRSRQFEERFPGVSSSQVFSFLQSNCANRSGGPLGTADMILYDANGNRHVF